MEQNGVEPHSTEAASQGRAATAQCTQQQHWTVTEIPQMLKWFMSYRKQLQKNRNTETRPTPLEQMMRFAAISKLAGQAILGTIHKQVKGKQFLRGHWFFLSDEVSFVHFFLTPPRHKKIHPSKSSAGSSVCTVGYQQSTSQSTYKAIHLPANSWSSAVSFNTALFDQSVHSILHLCLLRSTCECACN